MEGTKHITYDHSGKTAVITGGTTGIGRAIALALAEAGATVVIDHLNDPKGADATVAQIKEAGGNAISVQADVSKPDEVKHLFAEAAKQTGAIDILVNNASVEVNKYVWEMSDDDYRWVMANSLDSVFYCSKYVLPYMIPGKRGKIINISSIHDEVPRIMASPYCASKAGLLMLTKVFALELAPFNIQVNAVSPGVVRTERTGHVWEKIELNKAAHAVIEANPYKRAGVVSEIVEPVLYLCSPFSSYTNGTTLYVDGGYRLHVSPLIEGDPYPHLDALKEVNP